VNVVPASSFDRAELARLFEAGYEGYFVPIHVDEAAFAFMVDAWDIDLDGSRVAVQDGAPVGVTMLGVRGDRGWIGGLGVLPAHRRRGVGRALMDAVLEDAPPSVSLEVIEQNEPALRLYERLGFARTRMLEIWSLAGEVPPVTARTVDARPLDQDDLPWQRDASSLRGEYERIEVDGGAALVRTAGGRVNVLQLDARDARAAAEVLAAARGRGDSLHYVNVPEGDPASAALRSLGGSLDLRQLEMRKTGPGHGAATMRGRVRQPR
jgi:ribosomal protein S18 acetylase RimI-like enzyme